MLHQHVYDIPLYWQEKDKFNAKYDTVLTKHLCDFEQTMGRELTPHQIMRVTDSVWRRYKAPWDFNQVVGWIRIYVLGSQIRGDLWFVTAKRFGTNMASKQFSSIGKVFEIQVWPDSTSSDVLQDLLEELHSFNKFRNRRVFPDLEAFERLGPHIDWIELVRNLAER